MSDASLETTVKKNRGRPRMNPPKAKVPGQKRGRPKKAQTIFKDAGYRTYRVDQELFESSMMNHSNPTEFFHYIYKTFFKSVDTNEYFFYKDGILFSTGVTGSSEIPVHASTLDEWEIVNTPKIDSLIVVE